MLSVIREGFEIQEKPDVGDDCARQDVSVESVCNGIGSQFSIQEKASLELEAEPKGAEVISLASPC